MENENLNIWYNSEDLQKGKDLRIFVSLKTRGNIMLRPDGYDLVLFLTQTETENLYFQLGHTLQDIDVSRKEPVNE